MTGLCCIDIHRESVLGTAGGIGLFFHRQRTDRPHSFPRDGEEPLERCPYAHGQYGLHKPTRGRTVECQPEQEPGKQVATRREDISTVTLNRVNNASGTPPMFDGSNGIEVVNAAPTATLPARRKDIV